MHLLVYFPSLHRTEHPYHLLVEDATNGGDSEFYDLLEPFGQRLGASTRDGTVVVMVLDSPDQMNQVLSLEALLEGLPVAVVLPSYDPVLVGRAHRLRPRFLTYLDQEPEVLLAVLANIARKHWPGVLACSPLEARRSLGADGKR